MREIPPSAVAKASADRAAGANDKGEIATRGERRGRHSPARNDNLENMRVRIDARELHYRELNQRVREAVAAGERAFELTNVNGQRYIADGIRGEVKFDIHGVPGNDLGAFMDGPTIVVHGNAQDGVGNTMNAGRIVVHGHAGDVLGYGMRGGEMFVRGNVGYRVGIHMKAFRDRQPVVVAGGSASDFLGEYMAGGMLIVLGLVGMRPGQPIIGGWCGTGMHGGVIYLRGEMGSLDSTLIASQFATAAPVGEADCDRIRPYVEEFCKLFEVDRAAAFEPGFVKIAPVSHRPFGAKYAA
jgi:glutamate synthase domain-containing protein 3